MINSITSNMPTFKSFSFKEGLNVVLSDSTVKDDKGRTRNSAGKSSLIEVIHFLLGADCDPDSIFRANEIINYYFQGDFEFGSKQLAIRRSGQEPSKIFWAGAADSDLLEFFSKDKLGSYYISNANWRILLGHLMFGIPSKTSVSEYSESYTPGFRSMFSYFARRAKSDGFQAPHKQALQQKTWDWQENLSYLFDLDWRIPHDIEKVRQREKTLTELKKAAAGGVLSRVVGTVAELRSRLSVAEKKRDTRSRQLSEFRVLDSYQELSEEAAKAKNELQGLARNAVSINEKIKYLEDSLKSEVLPEIDRLTELYSSIGIDLPGIALKRLEDVRAFYSSVVKNRKIHLEKEISDHKKELDEIRQKSSELDEGRSKILNVLKGAGALEDFSFLQQELAELNQEVSSLRDKFETAQILEGEQTQLQIDRANIYRRLQQDFKERFALLEEAIILVVNIIETLYADRESSFQIRATENGPEFLVSIEGDRGGGIGNMEIFSFDLALFSFNIGRDRGPGFLVHDSHLFDGVDERQIANALELGQTVALKSGAQYIVTMNSDIFDRLPFSESFDRAEAILEPRLSDESESGGLFGIRFN